MTIATNASVEPNFGTPGQYSIDAYPPATLSANMIYSGEDTLTLTVGSFATDLDNTSVVMQVWSYNTSSGLWAFLYGQQDTTLVAPYYRFFQQSDVENMPGSRELFAKSVTHGNSWIVRGWDGIANAPVDTFVYPVNRCQTDLNPCHVNADCADMLAYVECTCQGEYIGDGFFCLAPTPSTAPIAIPVAPPRAPVAAPPTSPPRAPPPTAQPSSPPVDPTPPLVEPAFEAPSSPGNVTDDTTSPSDEVLPSDLIPAIVVPAVVLIAGIILLVVLLKRKKNNVKKYDNKDDTKQQLEPANTVRNKKILR